MYLSRMEDGMRRLGGLVAAVVIVASTLVVGVAWAEHEKQEKAALEAANAWLELVDAGKYAESWDAGSSLFRGAVTKEQWVKALEGYRKPLGKLRSRTFAASKYMTSVPGGPDGEYVAIEYKTAFEHKADGLETVTPMLDTDGTWRVSGYFMK
jgi:hypothetical protein